MQCKKAGLEVFGYVVNGPEIRVITKDKEPPDDGFDGVHHRLSTELLKLRHLASD